MDTWHRVTFGHKDKVDAEIDAMGIKYTKNLLLGNNGYLIHIDIEESDPAWPEMAILIDECQAVDSFDSVFDRAEISQADWNRLVIDFQKSYPQPEGSWERRTFESTCPGCGVHGKQIGNYRIKNEPGLGKNNFMSLFWTYVLFATPVVIDVFKREQIRGFDSWDVLIHSTSQPSSRVSQIYVTETAPSAMIPDATLHSQICEMCHTVKYLPHRRGIMQFNGPPGNSDTDIVLSQEWFGSGKAAYREILVSRRLSHIIVEKEWQGIRLKPIGIGSAVE